MFELELNPAFEKLFQGKDPFEAAFELTGESFRKVKSRHTFRIEVEGKGYFVKLHRGIGLKEYFKNLFQFKKPVTGADQEFHALKHLAQYSVRSMTSAAYGCRGFFPPFRTSFLITEELCDTVSLEDYTRSWMEAGCAPFAIKRRLIKELGCMAGRMHRSGLNHRDCYICHYMLHLPTAENRNPTVYVIDLHRAQIREKVPMHYLLKDLGGIWFSAMDANLSKRDVLRFLKAYTNEDLHKLNRGFWKRVDAVARKLYFKEHGKESPAVKL